MVVVRLKLVANLGLTEVFTSRSQNLIFVLSTRIRE